MTYSHLIRSATIFDGTLSAPYRADIALKDGKIVAIGDLSPACADHVIDANGRFLTPGFIDAHAHSERSILKAPDRLPKLAQGITTEITGQCGESIFPANAFPDLQTYRAAAYACGFATNQVSLVGHGSLRTKALGEGDLPLTETGAKQMLCDLAAALARGAAGMSTGLEYAPGMYSSLDEILPLAALLAEKNAVYTTHMRSEGNALLDAVQETIAVAAHTHVRTVISHLKACGKPNHGKVKTALSRIDAANESGLDIFADAYPYTAGSTGLSIVLPPWTLAQGHDALMHTLANDQGREEIRRWFALGLDVWENRTILTGWENIYIAAASKKNADAIGKNIKELARMRGKAEDEAFFDLLLDEDGDVDGILFSACEEDVKEALSHPRVMICSDSIDTTQGRPHPRFYGSHARYLSRYADLTTDQSAAEAIYKMTGLVADVYRLKSIGKIKLGYRADLVLFDPANVKDKATFADPTRLAQGIDTVFVGGEIAFSDGEAVDIRKGTFL